MFETAKLIIQLIPMILQLVKLVEENIPEGGKGKDKLAYIRDVLTDLIPQVSDMWNIVEKIISSTVTLYNTTGVFKK
jgi:hypothetical protein